MKAFHDGPQSALFTPLSLAGNCSFDSLGRRKLPGKMSRAARHAPRGTCTCWGM